MVTYEVNSDPVVERLQQVSSGLQRIVVTLRGKSGDEKTTVQLSFDPEIADLLWRYTYRELTGKNPQELS